MPSALPRCQLQTGSEPSDAAQQTHSAPFLQSHPGKLAGSLFLRAPTKPPCLKFLLVLFHSLPGFR